MRKLFFFLMFGSAVLSSTAQDSLYARQIICRLSSSEMKGRGVSYNGDSIAAAFLAAEMQRIGLLPLSSGYLQHYTYPVCGTEGTISLSLNGKKLRPYNHFRVFSAERYATPERLLASRWRHRLDDGTWLFSVDKLDTYGPIKPPSNTGTSKSSAKQAPAVCIEVLDSVVPSRVQKVKCDVPLQYHSDYRTQNVVGYLPGEIDSMIVFTAHYDHCGTMGDSVFFPGAHDNASGVAAVLDIARHFTSKPHYTMVFMLFSGEEAGLYGSHYAEQHPLIDFSKVRLLCNIDMFCGGDEGLMVFNAKSDATNSFFYDIKSLNDIRKLAPEIRPRDNAPNSDHYWFSRHCPAIFILTLGGPYGGYHDPADTCDRCGLAHYNDYLSLLLDALNL